MGRCSVCGKKIQYNNYLIIKKCVYCPDCIPVDPEVIKAAKEAEEQFQRTMEGHGQTTREILDEGKKAYDEFQESMEEVSKIVKNKEPRTCKYCGAKSSKEWLKMLNGEWCCKKRACRKKADIRYDQDIKQAEE